MFVYKKITHIKLAHTQTARVKKWHIDIRYNLKH